MAKTTKKKAPRRTGIPDGERERRDDLATLRRNEKLEREIASTARRLSGAIARREIVLRALGRELVARDSDTSTAARDVVPV
jgi:hypothetical protein